jgi:SAM-dependent methyltransferase
MPGRRGSRPAFGRHSVGNGGTNPIRPRNPRPQYSPRAGGDGCIVLKLQLKVAVNRGDRIAVVRDQEHGLEIIAQLSDVLPPPFLPFSRCCERYGFRGGMVLAQGPFVPKPSTLHCPKAMSLYGQDLAYIQAVAFAGLARGAAPEIVHMLKSAAIRICSVADVGCGAGVLTAALVEAGFSVSGIDYSAELIEIARARAPQARFVTGSVYDVEIPCCQAIVAVGEPLTYHAKEAEADRLVQRFFERASDVLPAGGLLIFDVIETGEPSLSGSFCRSGEDWAVLAHTGEEQPARKLVRTIETFRRVGDLYRRGSETHHVRLFDATELTSRLVGLGFAVRTAKAYGQHLLPPRRRAFFCIRQ